MSCTTTCMACGRCYEESSEDRASHPHARLCPACWTKRRGGADGDTDPRPSAVWLRGEEPIREHLGGVSRQTFLGLVADGMPVWREGRRWTGYRPEIDAWFRARGARAREEGEV